MPRRPIAPPLFATNPPGGGVVEPVSAVRTAGFATADRPPAQWFNWLFAQLGEWVDFLRSGSSSNWEAFDSPDITQMAVDSDTAEANIPIRRLLGISSLDGFLYASRRGEEWRQLTPAASGGFGTPKVVGWNGSHWYVGTNEGKIWKTVGDTVSGSAVTDDTLNWTATTDPGTESGQPIYVIGTGESTNVVAARDVTLMYSTDGTTFLNATLSSAATGPFVSVVWTGLAWIAITFNGEIYSAPTASGTWTKFGSTLPSSVQWRLATDGTTTIAAHDTGGQNWYISDNVGTTWTLHTPPTLTGTIYRIRYLDGQWYVVGSDAPFISSSNDLSSLSWVRARLPSFDDGAPVFTELQFSEGALIAGSTSGTFVGLRAEDTAPGPWAPPGTPAQLHDAAYLRGALVDNTGLVDGEWYRYNSAETEFEPMGAYRQSASDYVAVAGDRTVGITNTASARAVTGPPGARAGDRFTVKDESNGAGTHAITFTPASGQVEGSATDVVNTNRGAKTWYFNGTDWWLESKV